MPAMSELGLLHNRSSTESGSRFSILRCRRSAMKATYAPQQTTPLFDHLVGAGEQRLRHCQAKRLRGFEINHQLILGRGLHWQIGRLLALEDAIDITGRAPV